ncbi:hypothetical protein AAFF_G00056860 [Aldrovandia affinis]|uniref:Uncharacterized protein n=1 Tax=Aldrovandia affinis TaxID=143900 RepID=A0AAD7S2Y6_9TELE|nr:hypothetical protein AAFF_G00056860 [Aldrovandia affinis]
MGEALAHHDRKMDTVFARHARSCGEMHMTVAVVSETEQRVPACSLVAGSRQPVSCAEVAVQHVGIGGGGQLSRGTKKTSVSGYFPSGSRPGNWALRLHRI